MLIGFNKEGGFIVYLRQSFYLHFYQQLRQTIAVISITFTFSGINARFSKSASHIAIKQIYSLPYFHDQGRLCRQKRGHISKYFHWCRDWNSLTKARDKLVILCLKCFHVTYQRDLGVMIRFAPIDLLHQPV